ncbi:MAG TPA: 50S ribosomal protein L18, partial [Ktedonobacterales bacterium]
MIKKHYANQARLRRHQRVRKKLSGTTARPRLSVFRSATEIYAQLIDDTRGQTILAASSREPDYQKMLKASAKLAEGENTPAALRGL